MQFETEVLEVLEVESDAIKNFDVELPKESKSAIRKAALFAANEIEDFMVIQTTKKVEKPKEFTGGEGLTQGLDLFNLPNINPAEWDGIHIILATEEDLLFSKFFIDGEQDETIRSHRQSQKELSLLDDEED